MALKLVKVTFPSPGATGTVYTNSSNSFIVIIQISVNFSSVGAIGVADQYGNYVGDIIKSYSYGLSGSITGSDTFSSSASTTTGIANTSESVNENVSLNEIAFEIFRKVLVPPNFSVIAYQVQVNGFLAIQADSLEELRGFI